MRYFYDITSFPIPKFIDKVTGKDITIQEKEIYYSDDGERCIHYYPHADKRYKSERVLRVEDNTRKYQVIDL